MVAPLLALLLTIAAPRTDWMRLEAFHLTIGMQRSEAVSALRAWGPKPGKDANEIFIDYASDKSLTLEFKKDRLQSVRFELFVLLPEVRKVFDEKRTALAREIGQPRKTTRSILIYDNALPNLMVVVADDASSAQGKKGLGVLAVRYYDPR
jgi:hypothetical protein